MATTAHRGRSTRPRHGAAIGLVAAALAAAPAIAHETGRAEVPSVAALPVETAIELDGRLDEPIWERAEPATDFRQREPRELEPATERTEVRVLYTPEALYLGVMAFDREPQRIVALEMGRDVGIRRDDGVVVLLDTFHDHRNAYFFETNPNGARTDALVTDEGRDANFEWDGVWDAAAARTPDGWSAEIAIPFTTLRFDPGLDTWGLQVRRIVRRKNEEAFWSPIAREYDLFRISQAGHLTGLRGLETGLNLQVKPYGIFSSTQGRAEADPPIRRERVDETDAGIDLKWGLAKSFALDLTYNTDFAETEVDEQQVNLTRFSLFFPEKREFFLENAGIFRFGPDLGGGAPPLQVFFSRRIGISRDGRQVPIDVGGRLTGRTGPWNVGLLAVQTDSLAAPPGEVAGRVPENLWSVARVQRNLGERSSVGAIFTRRDGSGGEYDQVYGLDADLHPTDRLNAWAFAAVDDRPERRGHAGGAGLSFEGSFWEWEASALEIDRDFEPDMGFVLRRGVRRYDAEVEWNPRPEWRLPALGPRGAVRNLTFNVEAEVYTTTGGDLQTIDGQIRLFGVRFESDDFATVFTQFREERLDRPFEIQPGVVIPAGNHSWQDLGVFFESAEGRSVSVRALAVAGDFFDGRRRSADLAVTWRASRYFRSQTEWNRNDVSLPGGDFVTDVYRQRLGLSLSPDLVVDSFIQLNEAAELLAANVRLNWIYRPGADLFVVYNQTWDAPTLGDAVRRDRQLVVKLTYRFQL